jgi:hypothetical protein
MPVGFFPSVVWAYYLAQRRMAMKRAVLVLALTMLPGVGPAVAQPAANACFLITEFRGWKAPDTKTIFIRVGFDRVYRLDLTNTCSLLRSPGSHLITKTAGPDLVCSAIDWDLSVSQPPPGNIPEHCIVKKMTLLSPDEVAAIPPKFRLQ